MADHGRSASTTVTASVISLTRAVLSYVLSIGPRAASRGSRVAEREQARG